jgi:hypothetical protein
LVLVVIRVASWRVGERVAELGREATGVASGVEGGAAPLLHEFEERPLLWRERHAVAAYKVAF